MDIFNKIGSVAEETYQTIKESDVTKKAINYAGIPALSVQAGKQESIIKKAYQELGALYYEAHSGNENDEFADKLKDIEEAIKKLEEIKAEIEEKKNYDPAKDSSANVVDPEETAQTEIVVEATDVSPKAEEAVEETVEETVDEAATETTEETAE